MATATHRIIRGVLVAMILILVVVLGGVFTLTNTNWGREKVRVRALDALAGSAHGVVKVGRISGNLLRELTLHDVSITDSSGAPFFEAERVHTAFGFRALIGRRIELSDVELVRPVIVLDKPPEAPWNFERIFPADTVQRVRDTTRVGFGDWLVLEDVDIEDGHLVVRTPWAPDTLLTGAARDQAIRDALAGNSRTRIVEAKGGYQQVMEFQDVHAKLPMLRIAHPDHPTRLIEVDSMRTVALLFTPPAADVRQLSGTFELDSDSLWFRSVDIRFPRSRLLSEGRYALETGDVAVEARADTAAFDDLRFAYPALPEDGVASFDARYVQRGLEQQIMLPQFAMESGGGSARGALGLTIGDTIHIHDADVVVERLSTQLIEQLVPGLEVPRAGTLTGRATLDGAFDAMQVNGDITFDDRRSGRSRVIAAGEVGAANGVFRARGLSVTLSPVQVDLARIAMPDLPIGGTVQGRATLNGSTATQLVARGVDLTHIDRGERSRITGNGSVGFGRELVVDADIAARPVSLVTIGRFAPDAGLRGAVTGPIRVSGPLRDLAVNTTLSSSDGGSIAALGRLDLASREIGYALDVNTLLFNANALVATAPVTSVSATVAARGRGFDPATMQADLFANVSTSTFDTIAVDSVVARLLIRESMASIDTLFVRAPGTVIDATGTFGLAQHARGSLGYRVQVDSLAKLQRYFPNDSGLIAPRPLYVAEALERARADSAREAQRLAVARAAGAAPPASPVVVDTPPGVPRDSLAGTLRAQGTIVGGLGGFDLRGTLAAESLFAMGSAVRRARADYTWLGALRDSSRMSLTLNADSLYAAGFQLDSVESKVEWSSPSGEANISIFQDPARDYVIRSAFSLFPDRRELRFTDLRMRFDTIQWATTHPGSVRWGQPGIEVDSLEFRNRHGGRIYADGRIPTEGAADLRLNIVGFEVAHVLGLLQSDIPARAVVDLDAVITGTSAAPTIQGTTSARNISYRETAAPDVRANFDYAGRRLNMVSTASDSGRTLLEARGTLPLDLGITDVEGPRVLDDPAVVDLRMDSLPLTLLSRFTDIVSRTNGVVVGTGSLRGPLRDPDLSGQVTIANAQARVEPLGALFTGINASVRLQGDTVLVDSLVAYNRGRVDLRGGIGIAQIAQPSFDLRLQSDNARLLDNDIGRAHVDADVTMRGPFDNVQVNGRARVRQGIFYVPQSRSTEPINAGDPSVFGVVDTTTADYETLVTTQSPLLANLRMNLAVNIDRDTWVRSREANIEVYSEGDLRIEVDQRRQQFALEGVVSTDRGEYSFLSKRFQIKRGAVTFVGTSEINPLLQLTAEYEVKQAARQALNIRILVSGTLQSPRVTLESDAQPPISQSDLLSYLAFGSESGSLLQFGGGTSLGGNSPSGGLVGTSAALATRQLTSVALGAAAQQLEGEGIRQLGADVFNITPADVPPELASGNFGAFATILRGTQVEFGRYMNTQTFLGLNINPTTVPGFRIEHRLRQNPGISIESTFQPRFFLPEPSLAEQQLRKANALGLFLVRRWRF